MRWHLSREGLYLILMKSGASRDAVGFVIKPKSKRLFSERNDGYRHADTFGPLYFRTWARKPIDFGGGK